MVGIPLWSGQMKIKSLNNVMTQAWCKVATFSRDEKGASGIEYVLVASIAVAVIAAFVMGSNIGTTLEGYLTAITTAFTTT